MQVITTPYIFEFQAFCKQEPFAAVSAFILNKYHKGHAFENT
jgi:hypothetical protein